MTSSEESSFKHYCDKCGKPFYIVFYPYVGLKVLRGVACPYCGEEYTVTVSISLIQQWR